MELGKEKYGRPFTEEQVENIKVVMRLTPLFNCIIHLISVEDIKWISYYKFNEKLSFFDCFIFKNALLRLVASLLILFYQLIIYPCFHKYIPSMLKRIELDHSLFDTTSYKVVIVSQVLYGIVFALILPISLEFTTAQSPCSVST